MAISASRAASAGSTFTANSRRSRPGAQWLTGLVAVICLVTSCAGAGDAVLPERATAPTPDPVETAEAGATDVVPSARDQQRPGAGRTVTLARGEEFDTWFAAAVYERLLLELGYAIALPAAPLSGELGAEAAFAAVARGQVDVWSHGLFPRHDVLFENQLDGSRVGDLVTTLGVQSPSGVMEGVLASRDWVISNGVFHLDDLSLAAQASDFDVDGNGVPDIFGCRVGTTCSAVLDRLILTNGWNIEQITSGDESILASALARIEAGDPTLIFAWTPSPIVASLTPGEEVVWMSVRQPNPDWSNEAAGTTPQECPGRPCITGFGAADVQAIANRDFVAGDPVAATLIEAVQIPSSDVSVQTDQLGRITGTGVELGPDELRTLEIEVDRLASEWISAHRAEVNTWLDAARTAR